MKIALLQLPVPSHQTDYPSENIPLGPAYLAGYARTLPQSVAVELPPGDVLNEAGDAGLLDWLEGLRPHVVGFGCYVWNVERSIHLARRIKERHPETVVVFGGPEVNRDNDFLLGHPFFDYGVVGEGEQTFAELMQALSAPGADMTAIGGLLLRHEGRWIATAPRPLLASLDAIPSPYLEGTLGPSAAGTVILETVRGCPYRCAYCYYHKSYPRPRPFALERIRRELFWAAEQGVEEVYFLDPCFARRPNLEALIRAMEEARALFPLRFQAELNAEDCTDDRIGRLARAGLQQVEVGLQSINPRALAAVGRRFDRDRFVHSVRRMRREGMSVMVDIMVGLPHDTVEDVKRAVDFVAEKDLFDELSLYPLSVLPGTNLRRKARELGIRYLPEPPYYVLSTPHMSSDDIRHAFEYAERATGIDFFPVEVPQAALRPEAPSHSRRRAFPGTEHPGNTLTVHLETADDLSGPGGHALAEALERNPHTLLTLVVDENHLDWEKIHAWAARLLSGRSHVMDREYFSTLDPLRSVQLLVRFAAPGGSHVLLRIPLRPHPIEAEGESSGEFPDTSRQAWVGFPPDFPEEEEDAFLERIWQRCPPHIRRLRIGELN